MRRFGLLVAGLTLLACVAAVVSGGATQVQARWIIRDLGTLGGNSSYAVAINNRGRVVGDSETASGRWHAFLWERGRMNDLGTLGGKESGATAINDHGQVIGWSGVDWWSYSNNEGRTHAFLWDEGKMRSLRPPRISAFWAAAINNRGEVVGWGETRRWGEHHAFLWQDGKFTELRPLRKGWEVWPAAINDRGQVVGEFDNGDSHSGLRQRAFLWEEGKMTDLGALVSGPVSGAVDINEHAQVIGSRSPGFTEVLEDPNRSFALLWERGRVTQLGTPSGKRKYRSAVAINEKGAIIVADARWSDGDPERSFLWQSGKITDLGVLPGKRLTVADDINNRGQVAGSGSVSDVGGFRAFAWENGRMTDLGTLGGRESGAGDWIPSSDSVINQRGQIVGWADTTKVDKDGAIFHAVLWTLKRG